MTGLLDLTGAQAGEAVRAGETSAAELFDAYRERAAADELNAFLWVAEEAPEVAPDAPLGGVPLGVKDLFCARDVPSQAGSRILEGYRPPYTSTVVERLTEAGAPMLGKTNMDEFAMGSSNENSGYGPVRNPWDTGRACRAAPAAGRRRRWRPAWRPGRSAPTPAAPCASPRRCAAWWGSAHLRRRVALRDDRLRLLAGPGRPPDPRRDRRRAAVPPHGGPRPLRLHLHRLSRGGAPARLPSGLDGLRFGVPPELDGRGASSPGVREVFESTLELIESLGGTVSEVALPHSEQAIAAYYVIAPAEASANLARFDGVRYGRRAPRARATCCRCTSRRARRASATRSSAAS